MPGRRASSATPMWRLRERRARAAAARARRREQVVRRPARDREPEPRRRRARDRERDRPERRRQDDALQPHHRALPARRGRDPARRPEPRRPAGAQDHEARGRADLPDASPLPEHDGEGERHGGRVRADEGRHPALDGADAGGAPRGEGDPPPRRGEALLLRRAADGLPLGSVRLQPLVREPAAARDRAGDGDGAAHPPPRRAGGWDEPARDARDHGADRQAPRRRRLHHPRHRARHARRRGHLRPRRRARPRREDRRGLVRGGGDGRARRRGVPRGARRRGGDRGGAGLMALLELDGIHTAYGEIRILQDVSLEVGEGELVCLLGGNASGKSTTLKTILGLVSPYAGSVRFVGEDVTRRPTSHRIARGMAIVPENRRLFAPMSVQENLEMGAYLRNGGRKEDFERVYSLFPLLYERRKQLAGTLSGGEQQMVAMGRALMSRPKLLLMDEPSMGLAPILVERSFEIIHQVHESGVAMLVVEQNANMALSIADRGYVLSTGRLVLEGAAKELLEHEDLRKAYLGR